MARKKVENRVVSDVKDVAAAMAAVARVNKGEGPAMQDPAVRTAAKDVKSSLRTRGKRPGREYSRRFNSTPPIITGPGDPEIARTVELLFRLHNTVAQNAKSLLDAGEAQLREIEVVRKKKSEECDGLVGGLGLARTRLEQVTRLYEQLRSAGVISEIPLITEALSLGSHGTVPS